MPGTTENPRHIERGLQARVTELRVNVRVEIARCKAELSRLDYRE